MYNPMVKVVCTYLFCGRHNTASKSMVEPCTRLEPVKTDKTATWSRGVLSPLLPLWLCPSGDTTQETVLEESTVNNEHRVHKTIMRTMEMGKEKWVNGFYWPGRS